MQKTDEVESMNKNYNEASYAQMFIISMKRLKEFNSIKEYFRKKKEYQRQ